MSIGTYRVGADLAVILDIDSGTLSGTLTAGMVRVTREDISAIQGTALPMTVLPNASGTSLTLSRTGAQTALMVPGIYAIDVKAVADDGSISMTDAPAFITLLPSVM